MISLGDKAIVNVLNEAISLFRQNISTLVPNIYALETSTNQEEILTWWSNPKNQVIAQIGFSRSPVTGLQYAVTTGQESQIASRRYVGNFISQTSTQQTYSTTFETTYIIGVLGPNQNWLLWSQMLCKWALLYYTKTLETDYGLFNQRVGLGPLQPYPDSMGDSVFPFYRTVTFTAQHEDTWDALPVQSVSSASVQTNNTTSS
ncbi:hypothetical protein ACOJUR_12120 [Alicyclobacillus tolerans]|uniref:hypothetical protein n=1 Tax=Alicyclobacillus tolerans TaxID=90970 RepID=UPI003B7803E4